ncbi:hypothetical protein [Pseudooceanicola nanhaiensis]|jgi:hypothetical protein|uniref:Uncharacterized protein n=1 Tax=Pseudooceanicola nanhaiensis TaxID=375761 RepID=A0A917SLE1_9RHOB|nr:hypothetical protein [Pseudooceanicola nanhaiensis]GGL85444.1 hypothetical protein GCM10011534_04190 [Pseudooceanicola nanhaiensis]
MFRILLPILALSGPAHAVSPIAEVICEETVRMEQRLSRRLGAERQAMGLRGPEQVMELWTGADGDWTLVVTYASGTSCIVAMGQDWQAVAREPA